MIQRNLSFLPILISIVILFFGYSSVKAADSGGAYIKVDHLPGLVEKLKEKLDSFLKFSTQERLKNNEYIVKKRLGELVYVIGTGQGDLIEETSSRYNTYLGKLNNIALKADNKNDKEEALKLYSDQAKILDNLHSKFEYPSGFWILLQENIDSVKIFSDKLKQSEK